MPEALLAKAKSTINNPFSDLEAYQAIICIGKHGNNQVRESLFVQYFSVQRSYVIQRAILIAIQELSIEQRDKLYERAVKSCPEHTQLVSYLQRLKAPKYGVKKRAIRHLREQPRVIEAAIRRGVGKVNGRVVHYRLSRGDYDYE